MGNRILLAVLLAGLNSAVFAADPDDDAAESQWTVPQPPPPGAPSQGTPEGGYADPDRRRTDESLRTNVLDKLCRMLKLGKNFNIGGGGWPQTSLGVSRRIEEDFFGRLFMVDEETLDVGWGVSEGRLSGDASGSVYVSAGVKGESMVARRLDTLNNCGEVDRLVRFGDVKTVMPATTKRIMEMGRDELWRMPLQVNIGYGVSLGDAAAPEVTISVGYRKSKRGRASMTLLRLAENRARFRFRVDFVQVHSKSAGVTVTMSPFEFATEGANVLSRFVKSEIARRLQRYASASMGMGSSESDGRRLLLEYEFDPTNLEQAEAVSKALNGNVLELLAYAGRMGSSLTTPEETLAAYKDLQARNTEALGSPSYAARSDYGARARSFSVNLPLLVNRTVSEAFGHDMVTRFSGEEGEFQFHSANRSPSAEYLNVPFAGPLVKDLDSRNVDLVTHAPKGQGYSEPVAVYLHNQGFLRLPLSAVDEMVEDANSVLRLAGAARRGRPDPTMEVPTAKFMPAPLVPRADNASGGAGEPADQKGWLSMTLVMNQKAVKNALAASTEQVLKAFVLSIQPSDRPLAEWVVNNGRLEGDRLVFDPARAKAELGLSDDGGSLNWMAKLSREAAGLARDVAAASSSPTPQARAAALAKAFSHENKSGLSPRDVLRVLVQFMDPLDITGDFVAAVEGTTKKAPNVQAHFELKKGRAEVPMLGEAGTTRGRFAEGSLLTD